VVISRFMFSPFQFSGRLLDNLYYDPNKDENAKFIVADNVGKSGWEGMFGLTVAESFLVAYNMGMFFGWASVLVGMLNSADLKNPDHYGVIANCGDEVRWVSLKRVSCRVPFFQAHALLFCLVSGHHRSIVDVLQMIATIEFFNVLFKLVHSILPPSLPPEYHGRMRSLTRHDFFFSCR
jgi:hypothetical protein